MAAGDPSTRTPSSRPTPTKWTPTTATGGRPRPDPTAPPRASTAPPDTAPRTPPPVAGAPRTVRAPQIQATGPPRPGTTTTTTTTTNSRPTGDLGPLPPSEAPSVAPTGAPGATMESTATRIPGGVIVPGKGRMITQLTAQSAGVEMKSFSISTMESTGPLALRGNPGSFTGETPIQRGTKVRPCAGRVTVLKGRALIMYSALPQVPGN